MTLELNLAAIILAAGRGTRMANSLSIPKPLACVNGEPLLQRNIRQLHELGLAPIIVVTGHQADVVTSCSLSAYPATRIIFNASYAQDRNILSTLLGLEAVPAGYGAILLEGDVILTDTAMHEFVNGIDGVNNIWTVCGRFHEGQTGGIIKSDESGWIEQIEYATWHPKFANWYKNLGLVYIFPAHIHQFVEFLKTYAAVTLDQYYMTPWADHLAQLPAKIHDVGCGGASFNTPDEYMALKHFGLPDLSPTLEIIHLDIASLKHIEAFDRARASWLADKIATQGYWLKPLAISSGDNLVMDGQHRLEAAKLLGLRQVPCILFDYDQVKVYSLRPDEIVDVQIVRQRVLAGNIYPYKTVKHILPQMPDVRINLDFLR